MSAVENSRSRVPAVGMGERRLEWEDLGNYGSRDPNYWLEVRDVTEFGIYM